MKAIVAVYQDWGIGKDGTQPVTLAADRRFFRETTRGACVLVGRRTLADFPGGKPLPSRVNLVLSRRAGAIAGAQICATVEQAVRQAKEQERSFVIGGGSVYRQLLPYCNEAYVTKLAVCPDSDTWFPNLDQDPAWCLAEILRTGTEDGIGYTICRYVRLYTPQTKENDVAAELGKDSNF